MKRVPLLSGFLIWVDELEGKNIVARRNQLTLLAVAVQNLRMFLYSP